MKILLEGTNNVATAAMLTLIFDVGTRMSATDFRSTGSSFKQCSDDVPIAKSHSSLESRE